MYTLAPRGVESYEGSVYWGKIPLLLKPLNETNQLKKHKTHSGISFFSVSYTHLTLPTIYSV